MTRLEVATQRLEKAVARLEAALQGRDLPAGSEPEALARALEEARAEAASLREVTETVSGRLDNAIGRLRTALEG